MKRKRPSDKESSALGYGLLADLVVGAIVAAVIIGLNQLFGWHR